MEQQVIKLRKKGVALVVVMLIILAATAIALVSIRVVQNDTRATTAFKFNRQAAQVANQVGGVVGDMLNNDTSLEIASETRRNSIEQAYTALGSDGTTQDAWANVESTASWYFPSQIAPYTGLTSTANVVIDNRHFAGDLSRPIIQAGAIGDLAMNTNQVEGFSNGDAFCSQTVHAEGYALVGKPIKLRKASGKEYYLLADLNLRISGYKREMGVYLLDPLPCN